MCSADIRIATVSGYPYPNPPKTALPYSYPYPRKTIRIRIRIRIIRKISGPTCIRIRFSPDRTETIRSVFNPSFDRRPSHPSKPPATLSSPLLPPQNLTTWLGFVVAFAGVITTSLQKNTTRARS